MRTIRTREKARSGNAADSPVALSKRMRDSFVRAKGYAGESRGRHGDSPSDYAIDSIQEEARGVADDIVYRLPRQRKKARGDIQRVKSSFQMVKGQMLVERSNSVVQADKAANMAKGRAVNLRELAYQARGTADKAKETARAAKQRLKRVRTEGRRTLREVKQGVRFERLERLGGGTTKTDGICAPSNAAPRFDVPGTRESEMARGMAINPISKPAPIAKPPDMPLKGALRGGSGMSSANAVFPVRGEVGCLMAVSAPTNQMPINPMQQDSMPASLYPVDKAPTNPMPSKLESALKPLNPSAGDSPSMGLPRSNYLGRDSVVPRADGDASGSMRRAANGIKATARRLNDAPKGTIKSAKKTVKAAERSAKEAVRAAQQAAKAAQKSSKAAEKSARAARVAARTAAKAAARISKVVSKAAIALVKAAFAAVKGLVAAIAAGGWVAVAIVLVVVMAAMIAGSIFGVFFSGEPDPGSGLTINDVISEIDGEYSARISGIISMNAHDRLEMSGARATWKNVIAVYAVMTVSDPDNPMDVTVVDDERAAMLRSVFWEMNSISYSLDTVEIVEDVLDANGLPTEDSIIISESVLRIVVANKTADDMAAHYGFSDEQMGWLGELLDPEYHSLWNALLYGIASIGGGSMIEVAITQLGNVGGEPYWSWYGFQDRVAWCACFVSWVANECRFIDAGTFPGFSFCPTGEQLFKERGQWRDGAYTPVPGDIIFFDWEQDGETDHVGIVESVEGSVVYTIEGNTSNSVARRSYEIGSVKIYGYGVPDYGTHVN